MNILVVSNNYPSSRFPVKGIFLYQLVQMFISRGNSVTIIAPEKYTLKSSTISSKDVSDDFGNVHRPKYISFSNRTIGPFNTYFITRKTQELAVKKTYSELSHDYDLVYAHFLYNALIAVKALEDKQIPIFVGVGENRGIELIRSYYNDDFYKSLIMKIQGFIAVSDVVRQKLLTFGVDSNKILVEPNCVALEKFNIKIDKSLLAKEYRLNQNDFHVIFVGRFIESKGPLRVLSALENLNPRIKGIFIGKGKQRIEGERVAYAGALDHENVIRLMKFSDLFVFPTLHEGSSNVIIEAMASGLPIVSSDIPEIKEQCNKDNCVFVDPYNIEEIARSIELLEKDRDLRAKMSQASLVRSQNFDLENRADRILEFIQQ